MDTTAFFARRGTTLFALWLAGAASCACSGTDRLKKQVAGLETQITAMRADQDRLDERLAAVELSSQIPRSAAARAPEAERVERPRLKVIHLAPDEPESAADPADANPSATDASGRRPIIRGTGDRVIKVGDGEPEAANSTERDTRPVAALGREFRGN